MTDTLTNNLNKKKLNLRQKRLGPLTKPEVWSEKQTFLSHLFGTSCTALLTMSQFDFTLDFCVGTICSSYNVCVILGL